MEEGAIQNISPSPEDEARRLLWDAASEEAGPEALAAAAERLFVQLRAHFSVLIGPTGFDTLWARAMVLGRRQLQAAGVDGETLLHSPPDRWRDAAKGSPRDEAEAALVAGFASFVALLSTFIGEDLGSRLISQARLESPRREADPAKGGLHNEPKA